VDKVDRLTLLVWTHVGMPLEDIFAQYPSRLHIVRRLLASGNDPLDVITADMTTAEQYRISLVAQRISQLRHLCPHLIHPRPSRKE
jgi:hypothetical protein